MISPTTFSIVRHDGMDYPTMPNGIDHEDDEDNNDDDDEVLTLQNLDEDKHRRHESTT